MLGVVEFCTVAMSWISLEKVALEFDLELVAILEDGLPEPPKHVRLSSCLVVGERKVHKKWLSSLALWGDESGVFIG